jgi:2-polyprenyl-3-methyl-5-hydroxy-6-metoxy-1,4-benzoquinol methylase
MIKSYTEINNCLCCNLPNQLLLDLGYQPLANNFHEKNISCDNYPLRLMLCKNCYHCQLSHIIDPSILFKNYKYVSGTSQTGLDFFKENAEFIVKYKNLPNGKVLDIACNDGSQLNYFKEFGWNTYGVDPAENICPIAESKGHTIICDYWNITSASKLPIMNVITAQNVFAHTQFIDEFLQNCKLVMDCDTSLFIQTSQKDMIKNGEFDTIYHEHISFFNTKSMKILTERNGLVLNRVLEHNIHGKSYIFEIKLNKDDTIYNVDKYLDDEEKLGLYSNPIYEHFSSNSFTIINNLKNKIEKYKNDDYKCIGFGAAAKGQTILCVGNIKLDYIIDENPMKIGEYSPKLDIPIVSLDHFMNDENNNFLIVILAWNFAKEIKEKISKIKENKKIIVIENYFPDIVINDI